MTVQLFPGARGLSEQGSFNTKKGKGGGVIAPIVISFFPLFVIATAPSADTPSEIVLNFISAGLRIISGLDGITHIVVPVILVSVVVALLD